MVGYEEEYDKVSNGFQKINPSGRQFNRYIPVSDNSTNEFCTVFKMLSKDVLK
jgi:hypothetical protein